MTHEMDYDEFRELFTDFENADEWIEIMSEPNRKTYHIVVSEFIVGEISVYISDTEPDAYSDRLVISNDEYLLFIYSHRVCGVEEGIAIGRAIERKEAK